MHSKIMLDIKGKIISGTWLPGRKIPYETQLAEHYGVSRMTVNKVLTQLAHSGFLERRRKLGTIVRIPNVQSAVLEIADIESEAKALGSNYSYQLLSRSIRKPNKADLGLLAGGAVQQVMQLTCLHLVDNVPFCSEERLINLDAVPQARDADFRLEPPSKWLLSHTPWSSAKHVIGAVAASTELSKKLAIKSETACLVVQRTTEHDGKPITYTRLSYPGAMHQMVAQFTPSKP